MTVYSRKVPKIPLGELVAQPQPIVAFGREYPSGHLIESHHHDRAQLIFASRGIMRVDTADGIWVVPPMRAIWVPPTVTHEIRAFSTVHLRTLFVQPTARNSLPGECCVIEVSPLLRELILRMVAQAAPGDPAEASTHMIELILDEIRGVKVLPMHIDRRAHV